MIYRRIEQPQLDGSDAYCGGPVGPLPSEKVTEPSPRLIRNNLLARPQGSFASTLNLLAAAWIQFQVHDWFNHGSPALGNEFEVALPHGDDWPHNSMRIHRTRPDPTRTDPNRSYPPDGPADGYMAFPSSPCRCFRENP